MTTPQNITFDSYLPTSIYLPPDQIQMLIRLQAYLREISLKVNIRQLGFYETIETPAGQNFFSLENTSDASINRLSFRKVFSFGTIAPGALLQIPINEDVVFFTNIYGTAVQTGPIVIPLPYVDTVNVTNQVSVDILNGNIEIQSGATATNIDNGIIVLEYLKN